MRTIFLLGGILLFFIPCTVNAQPPVPALLPEKPSLFSGLPEEFQISSQAIEKIFTGTSTGYIKISLENHGYFEGYVMEKVKRSTTVTTVNIRLTNYDGALFTLSKITSPGEKESYVGRIIHPHYGDALLAVNIHEKIMMKKEKQSLLLVE